MTARRILVVSHLSPPLGGMTPLHVSRLVGLLADQGHEIDLLTMRPWDGHPVYIRDGRASALRGARLVTRTFAGPVHAFVAATQRAGERGQGSPKSTRSAALQWLYRWLGKQLLIPDPSVDWMPFALLEAARMEKSRDYDLILTVAHPVTSHLIGWAIHRRLVKKWIGYYLDPWSFNPDMLTQPRWRRRLDRTLEGAMLGDMNLVVLNTEETRAGYLKHFPKLGSEKTLVSGIGYEPADYVTDGEALVESRFTLLYTGIFTAQRSPAPLFAALADVPKATDMTMIVAGNTDSYSGQATGDSDSWRVRFIGQQSHTEVVRLQRSATVLVLVGWPGGYQIPAKLYEYVGARKPILAIRGDADDPAARLVERLNRGLVVSPEPNAIRAALCALHEMHKSGTINEHFDLSERPEYSWPEQLAPLVDAVRRLAD